MKNKTLFILIIFICSLSKTVYGSNLICELTRYNCPSVDYEELVKVENLYHKKFDDKPFTGKVIGRLKGEIKKGKMIGQWICFTKEGRIRQKTNFINNEKHGESIVYHPNGTRLEVMIYKNGKRLVDAIIHDEIYNSDGQLQPIFKSNGAANLERENLRIEANKKKCKELSD